MCRLELVTASTQLVCAWGRNLWGRFSTAGTSLHDLVTATASARNYRMAAFPVLGVTRLQLSSPVKEDDHARGK
jgi:hypothetical protein